MQTTQCTAVTPEGRLELPPEIQATLTPGDEYLIWQTEDSILFKKVKKPLSLADIRNRVNKIGLDPAEPTLEDLSQMVREVRERQ